MEILENHEYIFPCAFPFFWGRVMANKVMIKKFCVTSFVLQLKTA